MLKTEHAPTQTRENFWRPERRAWAVMLGAFAVFCMLVSIAGYGGYRLLAAPRARAVSAQVIHPQSVMVQRSGMMRSEILDKNAELAQGDRISTLDGPSGIAAQLKVGTASVSLWPLTTILVEQGGQGAVRLRLEGGQAIIDLHRDGNSLFVTGPQIAQQIELTPPGRYRIRELSPDNGVTAMAERSLGAGFEVVTDQGLARMGEVTITSGRRLIAAGTTRLGTARWSLVRDGDFSTYGLDEYRATLSTAQNIAKADTWFVTRQALAQGANAKSGFFYLIRECSYDPEEPADCRNVVRLARLGGNEKDSITGIIQEVAADVSAYRAVKLEADVRVDYQSLSKGGADGSECPLFAQIEFGTSTTPNASQWFCFWAFDYGHGEISAQPYIHSLQIEPKSWYHFAVDLREIIPDLAIVHKVIFYSNGHDYDAGVADISLWAEGLNVPLQP